MGWNTTVVVYNDALGAIEKDPQFGKNLASAISSLQGHPRGTRVDVPAGNHANAAMVVETHHADSTAVVTVAGNLGICHKVISGWDHHTREGQVKALRAWADELGFGIVSETAR